MDSAASSASVDSSSLESRAGAEGVPAPAGCSVRERVSRLERVLLGRCSSDDADDGGDRDARYDPAAFPCISLGAAPRVREAARGRACRQRRYTGDDSFSSGGSAQSRSSGERGGWCSPAYSPSPSPSPPPPPLPLPLPPGAGGGCGAGAGAARRRQPTSSRARPRQPPRVQCCARRRALAAALVRSHAQPLPAAADALASVKPRSADAAGAAGKEASCAAAAVAARRRDVSAGRACRDGDAVLDAAAAAARARCAGGGGLAAGACRRPASGKRSSVSSLGSLSSESELREEISTSALIEFYERKARQARAAARRFVHRCAREHAGAEGEAILRELGGEVSPWRALSAFMRKSEEDALPPRPLRASSPLEFTYVRRALSALRLLEAARERWPRDAAPSSAPAARCPAAAAAAAHADPPASVDRASSAVSFFEDRERGVGESWVAAHVDRGCSPVAGAGAGARARPSAEAASQWGEDAKGESAAARRRRRRRRRRAGDAGLAGAADAATSASDSRSLSRFSRHDAAAAAAATGSTCPPAASPRVESAPECDRSRSATAAADSRSHSAEATARSTRSSCALASRSRSGSAYLSRSRSRSRSRSASRSGTRSGTRTGSASRSRSVSQQEEDARSRSGDTASPSRSRSSRRSHTRSLLDSRSRSKSGGCSRSESTRGSYSVSRSESPSASERLGDGSRPAFPVHLSRRESWTGSKNALPVPLALPLALAVPAAAFARLERAIPLKASAPLRESQIKPTQLTEEADSNTQQEMSHKNNNCVPAWPKQQPQHSNYYHSTKIYHSSSRYKDTSRLMWENE